MTTLFGVGAVVMRGAGCTINDMLDRKLDQGVARTRTRPIASGQISIPQASVFLGGQLGVGLAILLQMNWQTIYLGASSLILVSTYPLFKRITYYPQFILGLAFNWGALLGYPALIGGDLGLSTTIPLFCSGVLWTVVYDTIYAHQDKADDVKMGIKSTALKFGDKTKPIISGMALAQMGLLTYAGVSSGVGPLFYAVSVGMGGLHLGSVIRLVDLDDPESCGKWFKKCVVTGAIIWAGIVMDYIYKLYYLPTNRKEIKE